MNSVKGNDPKESSPFQVASPIQGWIFLQMGSLKHYRLKKTPDLAHSGFFPSLLLFLLLLREMTELERACRIELLPHAYQNPCHFKIQVKTGWWCSIIVLNSTGQLSLQWVEVRSWAVISNPSNLKYPSHYPFLPLPSPLSQACFISVPGLHQSKDMALCKILSQMVFAAI